tara:strand:+ start:1291 stop:2244 length:954 start_codon:yes stop_codon:yes gene_type:complete
MEKNYIPWIEKYRPDELKTIAFDPINKEIFNNILKTNYFPNLLIYGPPGTGKTTSIINLIKEYQIKNNQSSKELIQHLNASDERGIDTIRNQINLFVNSKTLFSKGKKFVILDEVDYMTINAQLAVINLINNGDNVVFCLICNYISKIIDSLQNGFIKLRFDKIPDNKIYDLLHLICKKENLKCSNKVLVHIKNLYNSDIRSMINYLQSNRNYNLNCVINNEINKEITEYFKKNIEKQNKNILNKNIYTLIKKQEIKYKMDTMTFIKQYFNYLIRNETELINNDVIKLFNFIIHINEYNNDDILNYFITRFIFLLET